MGRIRVLAAVATVCATASLSALTPSCDLNPQPLPPHDGFNGNTAGGGGSSGTGAATSSGGGSDHGDDGGGLTTFGGSEGGSTPVVKSDAGADGGVPEVPGEGGAVCDALAGDSASGDSGCEPSDGMSATERGCSCETPEPGE